MAGPASGGVTTGAEDIEDRLLKVKLVVFKLEDSECLKRGGALGWFISGWLGALLLCGPS